MVINQNEVLTEKIKNKDEMISMMKTIIL